MKTTKKKACERIQGLSKEEKENKKSNNMVASNTKI